MTSTLLHRAKALLCAWFFCLAAGVSADDTEIFFGQTLPYSPYATTGDIAPPNPNYPNILFVLDASESMKFFDDGPTSRLQRLQEAMDILLKKTSGVNIGIMRFSHLNSGGRVIYPMSPIEHARDDALDMINSMNIDWFTPTVGAVLESAYYWTGAPVYYGTNRAAEESYKHIRVHTGRVSHPESYTGGNVVRADTCTDDNLDHLSCANERIDGDPVYISPLVGECQSNFQILISDGAATGGINKSHATDLTGEACTNRFHNTCGDELTEYLATKDLAPGVPGVNTVTTHTIGFNARLKALERMATAGKGRYFESSSAGQLAADLSSLLEDAIGGNRSFAAPAIAVDQSSLLSHRDDIYLGIFEPANSARWPGNLKRYQFDGTIKDANGQVAVNTDGTIKNTARSWWSSDTDGAAVTVGGAAALLDIGRRNVYTYTAQHSKDLTDPGNALSESNTAIGNTTLGVLDSELESLLKWARGVDIDDVNDGDTRLEMGDPLHSRPVILDYGTSDGNNSVVFIGTNSGYLHAIDSKTGNEVFSFIPPELLPNLKPLHQNQPASEKVYGLDGDLTLWVSDDSQNDSEPDHAYLYMGMRRGGSNYTALDVTTREIPLFLWSINAGDPGFERLGQTWSKPTLATVNVDGVATTVLIFGGGYDPLQDLSVVRLPDTVGNAMYMVDATTRELIWSTDKNIADYGAMQYSIPADPTVLDVDGDGLTDQVYVGDMGGQVWRFDIDNSTESATVNGGVIADLSGNDAANFRRFFYRPDVAIVYDGEDSFLSVSIGSGNRAHPLQTNTNDQFYMMRQYDIFNPPVGYGIVDEGDDAESAENYRPITELDLHDATENNIGSTDVTIASDALSDLNKKQGWYLSLTTSGEKVLAPSITIDHKVFFNTYIPELSLDPCAAALGAGRSYSVSVLDATPTNENGNSKHDRYEPIELPGIPPEPVPHISKKGEVAIVVGTQKVDQLDLNVIRRTYWSEQEGL